MSTKLIALSAITAAGLLWFGTRRSSPITDQSPVTIPSVPESCPVIASATGPCEPARVPHDPDATATDLPASQDVLWRQVSSLAPLADFKRWADDYTASPSADGITEGERLARARRAELLALIQRDPEQALANAVPVAVRRAMPAEVQSLLEERVDARGDLLVTARTYPGGKLPEGQQAVTTTATLGDGRQFRAFTYGRREFQPTRSDVPVHGIALDGRMAVSEWPGRVLEPIEHVEAKQRAGEDTVCPVSEKPTASTGTETALIVGLKPELYCGPSHAAGDLMAASASEQTGAMAGHNEASDGDGSTVPGYQPVNPAWTTGTKRLLAVRIAFQDFNEEWPTDYTGLGVTGCTEIVRRIGESFTTWSGGLYTVPPVQAGGSAVTPVVVMDRKASQFTGDDINLIWDEVLAALPALGYARADYPLLLVFAGNAPFTDPDDATKTVGWGGIGRVGGGLSLIRMNNDDWTNEQLLNANHQVSLHEIGHNLGLRHSSNIRPYLPNNPLQPEGAVATGSEYGDFYDMMGSSSLEFNVRFKQFLGWLPPASLPRTTDGGLFTLREHDLEETSGVRGLSIPLGDPPIIAPRYDLYVEYRLNNLQPETGTPYVLYEETLRAYGAVVHIAKGGSAKTWILDATPETSNEPVAIPGTEDFDWSGNYDSTLLPGRTVAVTRDEITTYVTNLSADPVAGQLHLDIQLGPIDDNDPPAGSITKSSTSVSQGSKVTLTANVTDPDDSDLAYHWQIPRFNVSKTQPAVFPNVRDLTVQFPELGVWDVVCIVSDKHGGTATLTTSFFVTENTAPSISPIGTWTMNEDSTLAVPFTIDDSTTPANLLTTSYSYTSSDSGLFNFLSFQFSGTGAGRTLHITPAANRHGSAVVRVRVSDGGLTTTEEFDLIVNPVTPGTTLLASGSEGWRYRASSLPPFGAWMAPAYNDSTWTLDNARFSYPGPLFNFGGWTIVAPVPGRVTTFFRKTFTMPVLPNGAGMIRLICDDGAVVYVNGTELYRHNMPGGTIFPTTPALTSVEGFEENVPIIIPVNPALLINGGTNLIAVEVHDSLGVRNGSTGDVEFDLEFGLKLAPVVSGSLTNRTIAEDQTAGPYNFSASDFESGGGPLSLAVTSSNEALFHPARAVVAGLGAGNYSLTLTPEADANGSSVITLKVSDGQAVTWRTFTITVTPVNDPPQIQPLEDRTVPMGAIAHLFQVQLSDVDNDVTLAAVTAASSSQAVLHASGVEVFGTSDGSSRWLRLTPSAGIAGQTTVTLTASDGSASSSTTFILRTAIALSPGSAPIELIRANASWRYTTLPLAGDPLAFTTPGFDDNSWLRNTAPFATSAAGSGNVPASPLRIATYFRTAFEAGAPASISQLNMRLKRDDGAAIYLNGTRVWTSNLPAVITPSTPALTDVGDAEAATWQTHSIGTEHLVAGRNVIAVEIHQSHMPASNTDSDLAFDFELTAVPAAVANPPHTGVIIPPGDRWTYWDQSVSNATSIWRDPNADDTSWSRGFAPFGYGHGSEYTVVNRYNGVFTNASVLFRKHFDVADPGSYTTLHLWMQRDDGAAVYLNGTRIIQDNVGNTAAPSQADPAPFQEATTSVVGREFSTWRHYSVDARRLVPGRNFIAVSVHQHISSQDGLFFDLQLTGELDGNPALTLQESGEDMLLTWPAAYIAWQLQVSTDLQNWFPGSSAPQLLDSRLFATEPITGRGFFKLVPP